MSVIARIGLFKCLPDNTTACQAHDWDTPSLLGHLAMLPHSPYAEPQRPPTAVLRRGAAFARTLALSGDGVRLLAASGAPSGALDPPAGAQPASQPSRAYVFKLQNCGAHAQADPVGA